MSVVIVKMDRSGRVVDYTTNATRIDSRKFNTILSKAVDIARIQILAFERLGLHSVKNVSVETDEFTLMIGRGETGNLLVVTLKSEAEASA
ncbi:MAG: hypothetical protein OWQ48_05665 [Desulfurococcus sp.]|nr:hypothetical protein [Desulfurococcus sp.]